MKILFRLKGSAKPEGSAKLVDTLIDFENKEFLHLFMMLTFVVGETKPPRAALKAAGGPCKSSTFQNERNGALQFNPLLPIPSRPLLSLLSHTQVFIAQFHTVLVARVHTCRYHSVGMTAPQV